MEEKEFSYQLLGNSTDISTWNSFEIKYGKLLDLGIHSELF